MAPKFALKLRLALSSESSYQSCVSSQCPTVIALIDVGPELELQRFLEDERYHLCPKLMAPRAKLTRRAKSAASSIGVLIVIAVVVSGVHCEFLLPLFF